MMDQQTILFVGLTLLLLAIVINKMMNNKDE